ncbi:cytochrome b/b6 domain-containing protein [Nocardia sp. NBC_00508]|uniref:cytochrome b n=1 Tax=Nocardia sp. NBC_00508 TaxID=2975992 RepID=UPI002E817903|nr:cytochrome b/b6 domain-containing protein [Nocardia sp. NBC_00508]WUD69201.1 cytochrome b/b6 domain-containing protein [Nocardia sp. NBC_00508]
MTLRERTVDTTRFSVVARILHWTMAALILAMIGIGAAMVGYLGAYNRLLTWHKTIGLAILLLAVIRIAYRIRRRPPPQIETMRKPERLVATGSEILMYALFLAQPLVGWALVSASGIPIHILAGLRVPAIAQTDPQLYAALRTLHSALAYLLLLALTAHICAVAFHAMVVRDKLLRRMTFPIPRR